MNLHHLLYALAHDQRERLRRIVGSVTYKPGWEFTVDSKGETIYVLASWPATDVESGEETKLHNSFGINAMQMEQMKDDDVVKHCITQLIRSSELHEMDEWFRYKGEHVRDPHPEQKTKVA